MFAKVTGCRVRHAALHGGGYGARTVSGADHQPRQSFSPGWEGRFARSILSRIAFRCETAASSVGHDAQFEFGRSVHSPRPCRLYGPGQFGSDPYRPI